MVAAGVSRVERGGVGSGQHQQAGGGGAEALVPGGAEEAAAGEAPQDGHRRRMGTVFGMVALFVDGLSE